MTQQQQFIQFLYEVAERDDLATLALLRRGCSGEERDIVRVLPIVLPHAPGSFRAQQAYLNAACLFGLHKTATSDVHQAVDLGTAMSHLAKKSGSIESRFVALLQCHEDELVRRLRDVVGLVKSNRTLLLWDDVLRALLYWSNTDKPSSVKHLWARRFWTPFERAEENLTDQGHAK